jgi:uncharacterized protein (DUF952 family)
MDPILHICNSSEWQAALVKNEYRAGSLESDGFIHCSQPGQILAVANDYFSGENDLVLLWIDPRKVIPEIRWEEVGGQVFPHIYGPLNTDAVVAALPFPADEDGLFRSLPGMNGK